MNNTMNRHHSVFSSLVAMGVLSFAFTASAHAQSAPDKSTKDKGADWIMNTVESPCLKGPKEAVIRASQTAPRPGPLVVKGVKVGGEVMFGTAATPFVPSPNAVLPYEGSHRIQMVYRPNAVTVGSTKDYMNITINCISQVDKNAADYKEKCSLITNDEEVKNVGLVGYQSILTIHDGTDATRCPGQVSMTLKYAVQPDIAYAKRISIFMGVLSDQDIRDKFKPGFEDLFNYWTAGFSH